MFFIKYINKKYKNNIEKIKNIKGKIFIYDAYIYIKKYDMNLNMYAYI